ncbi:MAG TPA: Fis family transcriptional regulator [Desulfuromonas sp.]|nr:Fis family transcriptional regulator [Desulfuromonas sp.]
MVKELYPTAPVLLVDDEAPWLRGLSLTLTRALGINHLLLCQESREVPELLARTAVSLVLLDVTMPGLGGEELLAHIAEHYPGLPVIMLTGRNEVAIAVRCTRLGAFDYFIKTVEEERLLAGVRRALDVAALRQENLRLHDSLLQGGLRQPQNFTELVSASPRMHAIFRYIEAVAVSPEPVLITGESGTGKELVARAIHDLSQRKGRPFVEINCGSLPFNLLETELFGHERGAFTDAKSRKIGLFEEACGGTVFLDEIGEMDMSLQVKLLRVLEDRKIRRLGGTRNIDIHVRVVAATNRNLKAAISDKSFREDLYYRLNVFPIHLPSLRDRREDIPPLLDYFIKRFSRDFNKRIREVSRDALDLLIRYHWPGNVRELRNVVERICIMHNVEVITPDCLPKEIWGDPPLREAEFSFEIPPEGLFLEDFIGGVEKDLIEKAFKLTGGNVAKTSRLLNVPRGTLRYKLEKYQLIEG